MRTSSSPGNSLPTLRRHGRGFRKPCLIGAAPGKASPSVYLLSAELEREMMGSKAQWYPSSFPRSQLMPSQAYYLWRQSGACRPSWVTLSNGSQDFGESSLPWHRMTQTEPAGMQPRPVYMSFILRADEPIEEAFRCYAGTQPLKTQRSAGANAPPGSASCGRQDTVTKHVIWFS